MSEHRGTFLVTHADEESAVVRNVDTAQVHALASNPGLEVRDVVEATVAPDPPMEVTWQIVDVDERRRVDLVDSDLEPTQRVKNEAETVEVGDLVRLERAGTGEIHVFSLPEDRVEDAATDVLEDEETLARAARLEAVKVEVRRSVDDGVLSVRYLPD